MLKKELKKIQILYCKSEGEFYKKKWRMGQRTLNLDFEVMTALVLNAMQTNAKKWSEAKYLVFKKMKWINFVQTYKNWTVKYKKSIKSEVKNSHNF